MQLAVEFRRMGAGAICQVSVLSCEACNKHGPSKTHLPQSASNAQRCSLPQDDHRHFRQDFYTDLKYGTGYEHECSCCEYMLIAVPWAGLDILKDNMQM